MRYVMLGLALTAGAGCANRPERAIVPVDANQTREIYDVTLEELRRIMTPNPGGVVPVNWSEHIYLNPVILLPASDSANPVNHDSAWMSSAVARGLVQGICGRPPATPCPDNAPVAFTSLTPPWTVGGDTVYVQAGYAGEAPGEQRYEGVFWVFTLAHDEETGQLKVVRKGLPNSVTFGVQ
jgi:hypothetical protein